MSDSPDPPEMSDEEKRLFATQTEQAEYANWVMQGMYPWMLQEMGYTLDLYDGFDQDLARLDELKVRMVTLPPGDSEREAIEIEIREIQTRMNESNSIRKLTPREEFSMMDPLEKQRTRLEGAYGRNAMAALNEDYRDPALEKELEDSYASMQEEMARLGIMPGSTAAFQFESEFAAQSEIAREQVRLANVGMMGGLYQSQMGINANREGGDMAMLMQGIALPGGASGGFSGGNPYADQRAMQYSSDMANWQDQQNSISGISSGMMGMGAGITGGAIAAGAAVPGIGWGLLGLGALTGFL